MIIVMAHAALLALGCFVGVGAAPYRAEWAPYNLNEAPFVES